MNRREFLVRLSLAGAGAEGALPGVDAVSLKPLHVIVVGAGLAGLCAAYELQIRGHRVSILEAETTHLGGRVRTLRFGSGLYGEAGAMRIPASHHLTRHYIARFGLPLRRFVEWNPHGYYFVHGKRQRMGDVPHPDPRYALMGIRSSSGSIWAGSFDEIVGGMDRLAGAFVQRLDYPVLSGRPVLRLEQDPLRGKAAAIFRKGENRGRIEGDYLICTLPLPVLHRIPVSPPLSHQKRRAMAEFQYGSADKTLVVARRRFWESEDGIFGGGTYTDLPGGAAFYPSDNAAARNKQVSRGPGVLLASYTLGHQAKHLEALPDGKRSAAVIQGLERVHPQLGAPGMILHVQNWSWDQYPWARGAVAAPGQDEILRQTILAPSGRIHFAGEHTSQHPTWIQGALESALRVVREIAGD